MMGAIQVSVVVTLLTIDCGSVGIILGALRNSTEMTSKSSESLVDGSRAEASACVFRSLGTCWILNELNALSKFLALYR